MSTRDDMRLRALRQWPTDAVYLSVALLVFGLAFTAICSYTLVRLFAGDGASVIASLEEGADVGSGAPGRDSCVIHVPVDFPRIQGAIDAAPDHHATIRIAPGTYRENIDLRGKNLVICSADPGDPGTVARTIVDGQNSGYTVSLSRANTEETLITGLTIRNGFAGGISGGGATAAVTHNRILQNRGGDWVSGIYDVDGLIAHNDISENYGVHTGSGLRYCDGEIRYNKIHENVGAQYSYGLRECGGTIEQNEIFDNAIQSGSPASLSGRGIFACSGTIRGNRVFNNSGIDYGYGIKDCPGLIEKNLVAQNSGGVAGRGISGCRGTIQDNRIEANSHYGIQDCEGASMAHNVVVESPGGRS